VKFALQKFLHLRLEISDAHFIIANPFCILKGHHNQMMPFAASFLFSFL